MISVTLIQTFWRSKINRRIGLSFRLLPGLMLTDTVREIVFKSPLLVLSSLFPSFADMFQEGLH